MQHGDMNLATLGGGAAIEKFQDELARVVANILDPNTETNAKREIVLRVVFRPVKDRSRPVVEAAVAVYASSKLAPPVAFATRAFVGVHQGVAIVCEDNPAQLTLEALMPDPTKVAELRTEKGPQPQAQPQKEATK
jgi:hypothetical protein